MITVVGLGSGGPHRLTIEALEVLKNAEKVYVRTLDHPVCEWLMTGEMELHSFDAIYEEEADFEGVYIRIVDELLEKALDGDVVYAVPGHPMVAEQTVQLLLDQAEEDGGLEVEIVSGESFLDIVFSSFGLDPVEGFMLLDAPRLAEAQLNPRLHTIIGQVYDRHIASDVKLTLMAKYPDDYHVFIADKLGFAEGEQVIEIPLYEMDQDEYFSNHSLIYVPASEDDAVLRKDYERLKDIVATLRSPEGCPWDREQTHLSLRRHLIEEAYEVIAAIEQDDPDAMCEELGDLFLQVLLHAQIEAENGTFTLDDVIGQLNDKLIRRHPHVFGEERASSAEDAIKNWEAIKAKEKADRAASAGILPNQLSGATSEAAINPSLWEQLPQQMPSLLLALEAQKKRGAEQTSQDVQADLAMFPAFDDQTNAEEAIGKFLYAAATWAKSHGVNPELALRDYIRGLTE